MLFGKEQLNDIQRKTYYSFRIVLEFSFLYIFLGRNIYIYTSETPNKLFPWFTISFSIIGLQHYLWLHCIQLPPTSASRSPKKSDEATLEWKNPLQILEVHVFAVQKKCISFTFTLRILYFC